MTDSRVTNINNTDIILKSQNRELKIECQVTLWAAGVQASPLSNLVKKKLPVESDKAGRLVVNSHCTFDCDEKVFVIGDLACFRDERGVLLPGVASVAIQQGRYVANEIRARINGKKTEPFRYLDKGSLAVIGRKSAVAFRKNFKLSGFSAWMLWLFVHLLYLAGFENRVLVAIQWAFNYFSFNQSARLITGSKSNK
jgi:NADH dehydrogenase